MPAPNYAQAFLSRAVPLEKPLLDTLIYELRRMTGVTVEAEHWNWEQIPSHLKMTSVWWMKTARKLPNP